MENASKALIMAGSILIGIIIMSIGAYLFASFGGASKNIQEQIDSRVLAEFNNNFQKYYKSKECTIHDIVSLASFAKKNNQDFESTSDYYVRVYVKGVAEVPQTTDLSTLEEKKYIELLSNNSVKYEEVEGKLYAETQYFECIDIEYAEIEYGNAEVKKRVKNITFRKI